MTSLSREERGRWTGQSSTLPTYGSRRGSVGLSLYTRYLPFVDPYRRQKFWTRYTVNVFVVIFFYLWFLPKWCNGSKRRFLIKLGSDLENLILLDPQEPIKSYPLLLYTRSDDYTHTPTTSIEIRPFSFTVFRICTGVILFPSMSDNTIIRPSRCSYIRTFSTRKYETDIERLLTSRQVSKYLQVHTNRVNLSLTG